MAEKELTLEDVKKLADEDKLIGEFYNIPDHVYHNGPGVSRSDLAKLLKSPEHLEYEKNKVRSENANFLIGNALHCYILEPAKFEQVYVVLPKGMKKDKRLKKYQLFLEDVTEDQKVLSESEIQLVKNMGEKFKSHSICAAFLDGCETEVTYYWKDPKTELLLKARLDIVHPKLGVMDIKTTSDDARRTRFSRACLDYNYDLQAAHYWYGAAVAMKRDYPFYFGVIEKAEPHGIVVHKADEGFIDCGLEIQEHLVDKLFWYLGGENPYSYPEKVVSLALPPWGYDLDARLEREPE